MINPKKLAKEILIKDENGNVTGRSYYWVQYSQEDNYVKLYDKFFELIFKIGVNERNVLLTLLSAMDYKCEVSVSPEKRIDYAELMGVKINTFDHYFYNLLKLKNGFVFKVSNTVIFVNPYIMSKGKWPKIKEYREKVVIDKDENFVLLSSLPQNEQDIIKQFRKDNK